MLDADTKRKIDTLRDILVGKIPNPQSQVEQITTGLIYKFMDDMDQEAVDLGERNPSSQETMKICLENLFDPKVGGTEKVKHTPKQLKVCIKPNCASTIQRYF